MPNNSVEKTVEISAPVSKVWRIFTDPVLTRQMGGEYVSAFTVGNQLLWGAAEPLRRMLGILLQARIPAAAAA